MAEDLNSGFPRTNPASDKGRDSNSGPLKYTSRSLTAWPRCLEDMMRLAGCGHSYIVSFVCFSFFIRAFILQTGLRESVLEHDKCSSAYAVLF